MCERESVCVCVCVLAAHYLFLSSETKALFTVVTERRSFSVPVNSD